MPFRLGKAAWHSMGFSRGVRPGCGGDCGCEAPAVSHRYYWEQRPATARTFPGAASQIANIEIVLHPAAIQNAIE